VEQTGEGDIRRPWQVTALGAFASRPPSRALGELNPQTYVENIGVGEIEIQYYRHARATKLCELRPIGSPVRSRLESAVEGSAKKIAGFLSPNSAERTYILWKPLFAERSLGTGPENCGVR